MAIYFFNQDIEFNLKYKRKLKQWIKSVVTSHRKTVGTVNYIFCSDSEILNINQKYLNHDYFTDIITFPYNEGDFVSADIFISIDTVKSNAHKFNKQFSNELYRVMIHGILHLLGYQDYTNEEKVLMRRKEDTYLDILDIL